MNDQAWRPRRVIRITTSALLGLFAGGEHPAFVVRANAVPDGARIVSVTVGADGIVDLVLEHETFGLVAPGDLPPTLTPRIESAPQPARGSGWGNQ